MKQMSTMDFNVVMNEKDISDNIEYNMFLNIIHSTEYFVDLPYLSEHKVRDINPNYIANFNAALLTCKRQYKYSLLSILSKISEEYIDSVKIKRYINTEVKWELIDEIRHRYPSIKDEYADTETDLLF
jgi:hypothetical protein